MTLKSGEPSTGPSIVADRDLMLPPSADDDRVRMVRERLVELRADGGLDALFQSNTSLEAFLISMCADAPHIEDLALRDGERLHRCLTSNLSDRINELTENANQLRPETEAELMQALRAIKNEAALAIVLSDISGAATVEEVIQALSDIADAALRASVRFLINNARIAGKMNPPDPDDPEKSCGYFVIAMGKHGAGELNYSSDIDVIVFYDPERAPLADPLDASPLFVRMTKQLVKIMQDRTPDGYVFRTDLRLRPDPGATPVAMSVIAALQYYESMGQNWERAALIKARTVAGDIEAGVAFLSELRPFVWRKYLDYAAISDVQSIKRQIHAHKGHGEIALAGHNIKLGRGGIREIEFFVQTQQLIAGGRNTNLRGLRTLEMLDQLVEEGWIAEAARDDMQAAYRFLRSVEHRIQMINDEQTQTLPADDAGIARIARLMGYGEISDFTAQLLHHLEAVQSHYAQLFEDEPELASTIGNLVFTGDEDDPGTLETLTNLGFERPKEVTRTIRSWHFGRYPATRSTQARERLTELTPALIDALVKTDNADAALAAFDGFLQKLPAGVQLFSLLRSNPSLLHLLATIMGVAPRLADTVVRRAHVLDSVLDPAFFGLGEDEGLESRLESMLDEANYYEDVLDRARIFGQEQMFLIGTRLLSGTISAAQAGHGYARLAEALVGTLLTRVRAEFERNHGKMPGARIALLAMGKLGGRETTATSDLDLILLYDFDEQAKQSDGEKPLAGSQYFIRLTQRLVSALSAPTAEGQLYEVDFRLRPSGNSGPLATHINSFRAYQADQAWTWERMALTRARVIAGDDDFIGDIEQTITDGLDRDVPAQTIKDDVLTMRRRIEAEKGVDDVWDIKNMPGGFIDVEFIAQYLILVHGKAHPAIRDANTEIALSRASEAGILSPGDADVLLPAIRLYHDVAQILKLAVVSSFDPDKAQGGLRGLLASAAGQPDISSLEIELRRTREAVRDCFERLIGPVSKTQSE